MKTLEVKQLDKGIELLGRIDYKFGLIADSQNKLVEGQNLLIKSQSKLMEGQNKLVSRQ